MRDMRLRIFFVLFLASVSTCIGISIIMPILPIYAKNLGAGGMLIGLIFSSFAITKVIVSPFIGRISDRTGKKTFIVSGLALFTLVAIAFAWARNTGDLLVIRGVMGVANAMVVPIVGAYIGVLAKEDHEAQYMALFALSILIGMGIGPLAGGMISDRYGIPMTFYAMGVTTVIALVLTLVGLPSRHNEIRGERLSENPLRDLLSIPRLRGLIAFRFIDTLGVGGMLVFLPLLIQQQSISKTQIGILVSVIVCVSGVFQVPFGRLVDMTGHYVRYVVVGALLTAAALFGLPFANGFWMFMGLGLLSSSGTALAGPAANALIVRESREIGLVATPSTLSETTTDRAAS